MISGISWHKFRVPTSGTLVQVDNGHFQAILGHMRPFRWKTLGFCPILMYEIDFYIQEESKNTLGSNGKKFSEGGLSREKIIQKWPNFHHFWNCGHIMPKHKTKIDTDHISVMINMCVKLE